MSNNHFVSTCDYLAVTRYNLVMTSHFLVGTRESLVVMCDSVVVTRYYLVRAFLCCFCFVFVLVLVDPRWTCRPTLDL